MTIERDSIYENASTVPGIYLDLNKRSFLSSLSYVVLL